jgi:hypothetical protein
MKIKPIENVLFLSLVSIILFSCNKESNPSNSKLLVKVTSGGKYINEYNYDANKRLSSIDNLNIFTGVPLSTIKFTYSNDKLSNINFGSYSCNLKSNSDSVQVFVKYAHETTERLEDIFYFNEKGIVDSLYLIRAGRCGYKLDENNNVIGMYAEVPSTMIYYYGTFNYDNKVNVYSSVPIEYRILRDINIGENNLVYYSGLEKTTYTYTYNSENYPIQCIIKHQPEMTYDPVYYDTLKFEYR